MKVHYISIFPGIFESFVQTSLIKKAQDKGYLEFSFTDPREFCEDKHRQVDDEIYGGNPGMLLKAPPYIAAINDVLKKNNLSSQESNRKMVMVTPSDIVFDQQLAHDTAEQLEHVIFLCGRYEGFDHRIQLWCEDRYPDHFAKRSLGSFITLGGEVPAMVMTEAIVRLLPGVIGEEMSRVDESYSVAKNMSNLEYPQYTRPQVVEGMEVPEILLSGHHKNIAAWKDEHQGAIDEPGG